MIAAILVGTVAMQQVTTNAENLPIWQGERASEDWLVQPIGVRAGVFRGEHPQEIVLANGLIARTFRIGASAATVALENLVSRESLVRAVEPEAVLTIDGRAIRVGGLVGQPNRAFLLTRWLEELQPDPDAIPFSGFEVGPTVAPFPWKRVRRAEGRPWPPPGVALTLRFAGQGVEVDLRYELFDGMPVMTKQLVVRNLGSKPLRLERFVVERLALVEAESQVDTTPSWSHPNLTPLSDYAFGGMSPTISNRTAYWFEDPDYTTQVNYELKTPCLLEIRPPIGPAADIAPRERFETFRAIEVFHDSSERERVGMAVRKTYRALAPWTTESPLMLHLTSTEPQTVRTAIDQAAECGFEMVIFSFGSGLTMEDVSEANVAKFRQFRDHAHAKGLEIGGYSLLASRTIDEANDVINPKTGKPGGAIFGNSPCLGSEWGAQYFEKLKTFLEQTGFDLLEHDGSYPGDVCASTSHPGHRGLEDSQWTQFRRIADFYAWCRGRGIYLNVPDAYFFSGSNKTAMGYRETNWSLPREQQHIHARQNLHDGTWEKTPTMGWMMVPLVEYHGGGAAATIEPLREHLADYELHLANNLGYGAQACYRGTRLYDSPETKEAVVKWVTWFKRHRDILESDVVHIRRADGRNLDAVLHVNASLPTKAMAVVYNPADEPLQQEIVLPLAYTGLKDRCQVAERDGKPKVLKLDRQSTLKLRPLVGPRSCTWFTIR